MRLEQTELAELVHQIELDRLQLRAELDRTLERLRIEYDMDPEPLRRPSRCAEGETSIPRRRERALEDRRERVPRAGRRSTCWRSRSTRRRRSATTSWSSSATTCSSAKRPAARGDREDQRHREPAVRRDVRQGADSTSATTFKTLFEGGDAELRTVGEDPLECEIEIVAKPRGKHLQSISLMSGGERALTAIALLFAIYLVKPSPFCLLDEVDAPLDDANVERFLRMLRRFSDRTQFVVITHNKKTMEAADAPLRRHHAGAGRLEAGLGALRRARPSATAATNGNGNGSHGEPEASQTAAEETPEEVARRRGGRGRLRVGLTSEQPAR